MKSIDLDRQSTSNASADAPDRLSAASSAAVVGLTSLLLWASIIVLVS
jgi:hypothetical protein